MKAIVTLDDLDVAAGFSPLSATQQVRIGWDGTWYELDLSDEHAAELWSSVEPYLRAGRRRQEQARQDERHEAVASEGVPRQGGVNLYHAAGVPIRQYKRELREWRG